MKKISLFLFALTLTCACNDFNDQPEPDPNNNEVSFTDGGIQFTRVTDSQFDSEDEVNVRAMFGNNVVDEALYTYTNGRFTSTSPFTVTEGQQFAYQAVYPSSAKFAGIHEANTDQSVAENYELSDLLVARVEATESTTPELAFKHVMTSIVLNIDVLDNGQQVSDPTVEVNFNLKTAADIDVAAQSYTASGDVNSITPLGGTNPTSGSIHNYSVIAAPQTVPANTAIANIVINGTENFQLDRPTALELVSGKQYIYTFRVDISNGETDVEFDGAIEDWCGGESDGTERLMSVCTLADFAQGKYPRSSESWMITDETATTEDFDGLRTVLMNLRANQRMVSLSFPNLKEFPDDALALKIGVDIFGNTSIYSITADVASSVGKGAFAMCYDLAEVSLPEAITIGDNAFTACEKLTALSLPKATSIGSRSFTNCYLLSDISLPEAITIGESAFTYCSALTELTLPKATVIGVEALGRCKALTTVSLPEATTLEMDAFHFSSILRNFSAPKVVSIGKGCFFDCRPLNEVSFPEATSVGEFAFANCENLTVLPLPKVEEFDWSVVFGCDMISEILLKNITYTAENGVFYNEDRTILYKYARGFDSDIFEIPVEVMEIEKCAFAGSSIQNVTCHNHIEIPDFAFCQCEDLMDININMATKIGNYAFSECYQLNQASFMEATAVGDHAFGMCYQMRTLEFPKVETIGGSAFYKCESLMNLTIATESELTSVGTNIFEYTPTENIYLYIGTHNAGIDYDACTWNGYTFRVINQSYSY